MKRELIIAVAILTCGIQSMVLADDGRVCLYKIDHQGHYPKDLDTHWSSEMTAKFLKENNLVGTCVDLESLGAGNSYNEKETQINETVGFLTNQPLTLKQQDMLKSQLCEGADRDCKATITFQCEAIAGLSINATPRGEFPRYDPSHSQNSKIGQLSKLPQFSEGCLTGKYSKTDAASSKDARDLLKRIGINISKASDLTLMSPDGERFWNFGDLDHKRDETASHDGTNVQEKKSSSAQ
jgi:hypothetical protein